MAIRKTYTKIKVPCAYHFGEGQDPEKCKDCNFFNGYEKDEDENITGVDCIREEIGQIRAHVTKFESGQFEYSAREYDKEKDGPLKTPYNYCEKCCFDKTLSNGSVVCLLRCSVPADEVSNFMCFEGEIWEKKQIYFDDDEE